MAEQDNFEEDLFADLYVYAQTHESFLAKGCHALSNYWHRSCQLHIDPRLLGARSTVFYNALTCPLDIQKMTLRQSKNLPLK